jgi:C4-dicarboxylate transporter, DctM subunit
MKKTIGFAETVIDRAVLLGGQLSGLFIVSIAFAIVYEIVMRGLFKMPSRWVVEYSTYGVIASAFLGSAYLDKVEKHIYIETLVTRLSAGNQKKLGFFTHALGTMVSLILLIFTFRMVSHSFKQSITSISILRTPMYIPEAIMATGLVLLVLQLARTTIRRGASMLTEEDGRTSGARRNGTGLWKWLDHPVGLLLVTAGLLALGTLLFVYGEGSRTIGFLLLLLTFFAMGMPIYLTFILLGSIGLFVLTHGRISSQQTAATLAYRALDSFTISAIPLYIVGSGILASSGVGDKLFDMCRMWLSRLPGNLSMATVGACAIFAAISGSSVATAAAIGVIAIPAMLGRNYDEKLALGCVAGGGTLGILIPPSLQFLLYGAITETSVGQLFIAGVLPGIMITLMYMVYIFIRCRKNPRYQSEAPITWKDRFGALRDGWLVLPIPLIVIGGIYSGLFTPTEAAGVLVVYAIVAGIFSRKMDRHTVGKTLAEAMNSSVMVLMIIVGAIIFGGVVTLLRLPQDFTNFVLGLSIPPWGVIVLINLLILILGCFLECVSITLITVPIIFPAIVSLGYNPVWFGVLLTINMELALVTPPVGLNLYVIKGISNASFENVTRGVWPFLLLLLLGLLLVGLIEPLATWLPSTMLR